MTGERLTGEELAHIDSYAAHAEAVAGAIAAYSRQLRQFKIALIVVAAALLLCIGAVVHGFLDYLGSRAAVREQQLCQIVGSLPQSPTTQRIRAGLHCTDRPHPVPLPPPTQLPVAPAPTHTPPSTRPTPTELAPTRTPVRSAPAPVTTPTPRPSPTTTPSRAPQPSPSPSRTPIVILPTICVGRICI